MSSKDFLSCSFDFDLSSNSSLKLAFEYNFKEEK